MITKESLENEVGKLYGKIYGFTDVAGDSALEFMDNWLEDEGKYDLMMEYICEDEFNENVNLDEVKELIDLLYDILGGIREEYNM